MPFVAPVPDRAHNQQGCGEQLFHKYPQSCSENTDPEHGYSMRKSDSETDKLLEEAKPWLGMMVLPFSMDKRNGKE